MRHYAWCPKCKSKYRIMRPMTTFCPCTMRPVVTLGYVPASPSADDRLPDPTRCVIVTVHGVL